MPEQSSDQLRYPMGRYSAPSAIEAAQRAQWITEIETLPARLQHAVIGLNDKQLETPYRPEGWTVRQVVHHVADSHLNSYVRFRLALTEDSPTIKPYDESKWAELEDARHAPVQISLDLLRTMHERWVTLLRAMDQSHFSRAVIHPEWGKQPLDWMLGLYAWHGRHHTAHIANLRARENW